MSVAFDFVSRFFYLVYMYWDYTVLYLWLLSKTLYKLSKLRCLLACFYDVLNKKMNLNKEVKLEWHLQPKVLLQIWNTKYLIMFINEQFVLQNGMWRFFKSIIIDPDFSSKTIKFNNFFFGNHNKKYGSILLPRHKNKMDQYHVLIW